MNPNISQVGLYIFGTGLYAEVAYCHFIKSRDVKLRGFIVNNAQPPDRDIFFDLPVFSLDKFLAKFPPNEKLKVFVAVSSTKVNRIRNHYYQVFKSHGYAFQSLIGNETVIDESIQLGEHLAIFDGCSIGCYSCIGANSILWAGASVGHHCELAEHVFMAGPSSLGGRCKVGRNSFLGLGSLVRDGVEIAPDTVIGAGCLIMRDTKEGEVYSKSRDLPSSIDAYRLYGVSKR